MKDRTAISFEEKRTAPDTITVLTASLFHRLNASSGYLSAENNVYPQFVKQLYAFVNRLPGYVERDEPIQISMSSLLRNEYVISG